MPWPFHINATPRRLPAMALAVAMATAAVWSVPHARAGDIGDIGPDQPQFGVIESPPDSLVPRTPPADSDSRSPDELFTAAISELQAGLFEPARRLLELFVARDPQHPSVPEARRHLSELYQLDTRPVTGPAAPETAAAPEIKPLPSARRVALPRSVGGNTEDSFMLEAGDRVFFASRSFELGSRARAVLAAQARWLKRNPNLSAVIEGHSDDPPLEADGLVELAARRAEAVFQRLLEEGVAPERLAIAPAGRANPVALCAEPECAAQNRRAVTVLTAQRVSELPPMEGLARALSR